MENAGYYSRVFTGYRKWSFPYSPGTSDGQMPRVSASVGSREGACPPYFWAKLRPEGPEKKKILRPPPSLSQGLDDRPPSLSSESATARATLFFCIWLTLIEPGCSLPRSRFFGVTQRSPKRTRERRSLFSTTGPPSTTKIPPTVNPLLSPLGGLFFSSTFEWGEGGAYLI